MQLRPSEREWTLLACQCSSMSFGCCRLRLPYRTRAKWLIMTYRRRLREEIMKEKNAKIRKGAA